MLEAQGRLVIGKELLSRVDIKEKQKVDIFFDIIQKALVLLSCDDTMRIKSNLYFIATHTIGVKGRFYIPSQVREAFPGATYLPTEKDGTIYILIIEHQKKSE